MKYLLLKHKNREAENKPISVSLNYVIAIKKLNPFSFQFKGLKANLFWKLISRKSWIAYLKDKSTNKVVAYAYIIGRSYKFPFMRKMDLQVGPAYTVPEFRGQGLFSTLLSNLTSYFTEKNYYLIALVRPENRPSLHVLEKNGYVIDGECEKNKFKVYHLIQK